MSSRKYIPDSYLNEVRSMIIPMRWWGGVEKIFNPYQFKTPVGRHCYWLCAFVYIILEINFEAKYLPIQYVYGSGFYPNPFSVIITV